MEDSAEPLLTTGRPLSTHNSRPNRRPPFTGMDLQGVKKRGQSLRTWIRIDKSSGNPQTLQLDKFTMMRRCDLPARDLRLLDPLFVYPSTILGREKAIVVNLEQIRCIITSDEVFLLHSLDEYVQKYVLELERRLKTGRDGEDAIGGVEGPSTDFLEFLPFEFRAFEVALEAACSILDAEAAELEIEAYPLLDELSTKINTTNLEGARKLKSRLVSLTRRVQKVRDEIEQLMNDDGDMAEMYLTGKKGRFETSSCDQNLEGTNKIYFDQFESKAVSAPVSPVSSPPCSTMRNLEKSMSFARSRHGSTRSSFASSDSENISELEMLLEAYFVQIDNTLNKLTSLKEYIDDTEDFINIKLDNIRNQLIQFELILTTLTLVVAIFGVIAGIFGMNFIVPFFENPSGFKMVIIISGISGTFIFLFFLLFYKHKGLMSL